MWTDTGTSSTSWSNARSRRVRSSVVPRSLVGSSPARTRLPLTVSQRVHPPSTARACTHAWPPGADVQTIPLDRIVVHEPLRHEEEDVQLLEESMGVVGLLHPLTVVRDGHEHDHERYRLVSGAGRLAALRAAGVPV